MASNEKPDQQPSIHSSLSEKTQNVPDPASRGQDSGQEMVTADANDTELEPVQSSRQPNNDISKVPNGGTLAWLQVFGAFFLTFNSWGVTNTFGSYQTYYQTDLLRHSTPSAIAWIGSVQAFLMLLTGVLAGPIYDAGYFRALLLVGSFMLVFGHMMLSLCHAYWQVLLSQAFCVGIGAGFIYVPSVAILSTYFSTRIGAAIGIAASGSSIGGVIYPIVLHQLMPKVGFAWATRILGFIMLGTMVVPNVVMRVRVLPAQSRSLFDPQAFCIPAYSLATAGFFCGFMGLLVPFFFVQVYAIERHITNNDLAFYLLAILNSTSTFGRILPSLLADKIGPYNVVVPCILLSGLLCILTITTTSSAGLVTLMSFYGFFSGTFVSLPSTVMIYISSNARDKIGTRLGQAFSIISIGVLIGAPIGGSIQQHEGFGSLWVFGGCLLFGSTGLVLASKLCWEGLALKK